MPIVVDAATVLPLDDVKAHLNITTTTNDVELQAVIDAAVSRLGQEVGPLGAVDVAERVSSASTFLLLSTAPAQSLTSVVSVRGTVPVDLSLLTLDGDAGTVYYADGSSLFRSPTYDVAYTAGWATVPADILFAAKELVRHLWQTQRGTMLTDPGAEIAQIGYALPNRVLEMIAPYRKTLVG